MIVAIAVTGGFAGHVGPDRVLARDIFNPLQLLWAPVALALCVGLRPQISARPDDGWSPARAARGLALMFGIFLLGSAPALQNGIRLLVSGLYVTQQYLLAQRAHWDRHRHVAPWQSLPQPLGRCAAARVRATRNRPHRIRRMARGCTCRTCGVSRATPTGRSSHSTVGRRGRRVLRLGARFACPCGRTEHRADHAGGLAQIRADCGKRPDAGSRDGGCVPEPRHACSGGRHASSMASLCCGAVGHRGGRPCRFLIAPFPMASIECPPIYRYCGSVQSAVRSWSYRLASATDSASSRRSIVGCWCVRPFTSGRSSAAYGTPTHQRAHKLPRGSSDCHVASIVWGAPQCGIRRRAG